MLVYTMYLFTTSPKGNFNTMLVAKNICHKLQFLPLVYPDSRCICHLHHKDPHKAEMKKKRWCILAKLQVPKVPSLLDTIFQVNNSLNHKHVKIGMLLGAVWTSQNPESTRESVIILCPRLGFLQVVGKLFFQRIKLQFDQLFLDSN
jgi:hypothetical protein